MRYVELGETGIEISQIAFGSMSTVPNPTYDGVEDEQGIATIRAALDHGINFFDTAPGYGNGAAEALLGRALEGDRDRVIIADKVNTPTLSADDVAAECEKSLKLLRTDYIDLYQIHWPKNVVPIDETLSAMEGLVKAGKVRALGVCNFGIQDLTDALSTGKTLVSNQIAYSMLGRAVEFEVADLCIKNNIGLHCYSPLAQGLLAGKFDSADDVPPERARTRLFSKDRPQSRHDEPGCEEEGFAAIRAIRDICQRINESPADVALAWLLHQPGVQSVLVGASRPDQVARNINAASLTLSEEVLAELDQATQPVKQAMGQSLDMWATPSRIH